MPVRPATPTDARAIAEVHVSSWRTSYRGIVPEEALAQLSVEHRAETWARGLGNPDRKHPVLVVEVEDRIVGFAAFGDARDKDLAPGVVELYAIYLLQEFQRQGLGRALWNQVRAAAGDIAAPALVLWVLEDNRPARDFYERLGFRLDGGSKPLDFAGKTPVEVRYQLSLA
ncbi:MAG: GNAT family N-acetyltransferase [Opitutales bacterium]